MTPYRALAVVEPLPTDPVARALRLAGALPFVKLSGSTEPCPFCEANRYWNEGDDLGGFVARGPSSINGFCTGKRRWRRPWGCALYVAHLHVMCVTCKAQWIMAPANVSL